MGLSYHAPAFNHEGYEETKKSEIKNEKSKMKNFVHLRVLSGQKN